jgi:hypothetical protein
VRGGHVEPELFNQPSQPWRLPLRQVEDHPGESGRVDDRVLERGLEASPDEPGVEGIVAVLDQHSPLGKTQKGPPRVPELRGADEHGAVDVVAPARVRIDGRAAVDQRVEERQGTCEREPLGADLEHQERGVAGGLDIKGDELRILKLSLRTELGSIDRDRLPRHQVDRASRLE